MALTISCRIYTTPVDSTRQKILGDLVKLYRKDELASIGHVELKRQVDERYYAMRKLATAPPPPPDGA